MSIAAAENAGPGPYELQDPVWVKMSTITSGITKKRKKSDAKPQSQINKCLNEKRRRNQENSYIDELAELISATDMSSGKTDKCQILQRTVEQIRHFRNQESSNSHAIQQGEVSSSNPSILSNDQLGPFLLEALDGFILVVNTEGRVEYVSANITQYINYTKDDVLKKDIYNIIHHGDHNTFMSNLLPMSSLGWTEPQPQTRSRIFNCRFLVKPPDDKDETMEEKQQRVSKYESMQINSVILPTNTDRLESGDVSSESDTSPCLLCIGRRIPPNEKPINTNVEQFTVKLDTAWKIIGVDLSWLSPNYKNLTKDNLIGKSIKDLCHSHDLSTLTKHLNDTLQFGENTSDVYRLCVLSPDKYLKIQTKSKFFKANAMNNDSDFMMATNSIITDNELIPIESGQLSNNKMCSGHPSNRCANNSNNNNGNNNNNVGGPLMPSHLNGQVSGISARGMAVSHIATSSNSIAFNTGGTGASGGNSDTCNPLTSLSTSGGNPFSQFSDLEFPELFPSSTGWDLDSAGWDRSESRASGPPNSRPSSQPAPTSPSPQGTFSNSAAVASHSPLRSFSPNSVSTAHTYSNSFSYSPLQETTQTSTLSSNVASSISTNGGNVGGVNSNIATTIKRTEESSKSGCPTSNSGGTIDNATARTSGVVEAQNNSIISTESGRLRNLLTMGPNASEDSQDNTENDSNNSSRHRILKTLLNQQDEDDYHSEHKVRTSPSNMPKSSMEHPKSSLGNNNMLLQLLNEKNDDEDDTQDTRSGTKKRGNEMLLQQLMKQDPDEERKIPEQQLQQVKQVQQVQPVQQVKNPENDLLRSLGFRSVTPSSQPSDHIALGSATTQVGQKRPGEDGDLNVAVKRPVDGLHQVSSSATSSSSNTTSKLWERNKMLASLLAREPAQTSNVPTKLPASVISATPQDKLPRVKQPQQQQQQQQQQQPQQQQPWTGGSMQVGGNNAITTTASVRPLQSQSRQLPRQSATTYLSHMLSQHQRPQMGPTESEFTSSGEYRQTSTDPTSWDNQSSDPDLSEILDQVIDFVPDELSADTSPIANLLNPLIEDKNVMNEKMAINAIQKSLMLCETAVNPTSSTTMPGTPPAYSTALGTTPVTTSHSYQPPPMYQQPRIRFTQPGVRQTGQFTQQQQLQLQQRSKLIQQQQQHQQEQMKQRLLQQQKQQQMVIPSNATATDQINSSIHNIDNLLNNTVAPPNVSLQRSSVPESQISPGYGGSVQIASGHRLAHSYSHPSTIPQHPIVNNNFNSGQQVSAPARLSPHSPASMLPFSHPQPLSPRVTQGNYGNTPRLFNVNQVRPQQQVIAQQQQQQQRSMPSPGTPATARQSPFPTEAFPPPTSPTASQFTPGPGTGAPNPSAQYRLQRATSTPSATTQLPGGIGSPRHYGGISKEPLLSPSHSHTACPASQHNSQHNNVTNTQHFSSQQHTPLLYQQHTNHTADMQNSQFCYDRSSVPLYPAGGEAQDARSLPPGNPVNHQMGGNASTSEFVRQELRAIVGARTQQQQQQQRVPNNLQNNLSGQVSQDDLEALGLTFEMSSAGEAVVSDGPAKSWAIGSAGSAPSSSRTTIEEVARGDPKSSLLQKLLSE